MMPILKSILKCFNLTEHDLFILFMSLVKNLKEIHGLDFLSTEFSLNKNKSRPRVLKADTI